MSAKSKVIGNSFLYTFSSLLVKSFNFILLPIYTLYLTPEDYGIVNLVTSFIQVATFIIAFSLYSALTRFYADYKDNLTKVKRFYGTVVIFVLISGITFTSLGLVFKDLLIAVIFDNIPFYPFILIALVAMTFVSLQTVHQSILQGRQQGKKLTLINLSLFGIQTFLTLLFVVAFKLGAFGMLLALMIVSISYFMYLLIDLIKNKLIIFTIDLNILKSALKYSIPIMPHNLSTHVASFTSRIFINNSGSLASVGIYSVASQFSVLIDTVQTSVNKAFAPWFYETMNSKGPEDNIGILSLSKFLLILYSFVYIGIGLFSQEVIILLTPTQYHMAWTVIPILVVGFSVKSIYYFYINILFYYREAAKKIFIATLIGSFSDIILAFILVPKYGMYGAALAFLIAKIIVVGIIIYLSKKYNGIGYKVYDMLAVIIPSLLFMFLGLYFSYFKYIDEFNFLNFVYKIGILFTYCILVCTINRKSIVIIINSKKFKVLLKRKEKNK